MIEPSAASHVAGADCALTPLGPSVAPTATLTIVMQDNVILEVIVTL